MFEVFKIINSIPKFKKFPSNSELIKATLALKKNPQFRVNEIGKSRQGFPIYNVKWGAGKTKALIVGMPHPNEPIGTLSILALFHLFQKHPDKMMAEEIEWNIIPCIDPEGMKLNEGWSQKKFSFKNFMENYYRQNASEQVEWSFPVSYKKLRYNKPSPETKVLMKIMAELKPDFYMPLHNFMAGGAYFYLGGANKKKHIPNLKSLVARLNLPLHLGEAELPWVEVLEPAFYGEVSIKNAYNYFLKYTKEPQKRIPAGASSYDYLQELNPNVRTLVIELPYVKHDKITSNKKTSFLKRSLALKQELSSKLTESLVLDAWNDTKSELNKKSPFYVQISTRVLSMKDRLEKLSPELFKDKSYRNFANEAQFLDYHLYQYYSLCWNYQFVRLLKASKQTTKIKSHLAILTNHFDQSFEEINKILNFSSFKLLPLENLAKCQVGGALLCLKEIVNE